MLFTTLAVVALAAPVSSLGQADVWSPTTYQALERQIVAHSNITRYPIIALFLRPSHFKEDIKIASAFYLDRSSQQTTTRMNIVLFTVVEVDVTLVRAERIYFRNQYRKNGDAYRRIQLEYEVECGNRRAGLGDFNYYAQPVGGEMLKKPQLPYAVERKVPVPGSLTDFVMKAVCDGAAVYQPK